MLDNSFIVREVPFLYTGYFAKLNKYLELGLYPISISYTTPYGIRADQYSLLAPKKYILSGYKSGQLTKEDYRIEYQIQLDNLNVDTVVNDLLNMSQGSIPILLCYEKPFDFCHRHIVADWINFYGRASVLECI